VISALNFAIERDRALHDQLRGLASRIIAVHFDGFEPLRLPSLSAAFAPDGLLEALGTRTEQTPDIQLTLTPAFFLSSAEQFFSGASTGPSMKGLRIEGDAEVAQQLTPLIELMRSRLSPLGQAASQSWPAQMAQTAAQKAANYAIHEAGVLATRPMLHAQQRQIQALRDRVARFEKRLQSVEATRAR
jgi:ubiquinone biosynthesis protein UbiJ